MKSSAPSFEKKLDKLLLLLKTDSEYQLLGLMVLAMVLVPVFLFSLIWISSASPANQPKYRIPTTPVLTEPVYTPAPEIQMPTNAEDLPLIIPEENF